MQLFHAHKRALGFCLATLLADLLFFGLTDPQKVAPEWLVMGFLLAVTSLYWAARATVFILTLYIGGLSRYRMRLVRMIVLIGALLIGMQSIGQLTVKDLVVLVPLAALGYFYVAYAARRSVPDR